MDTRIYQYMIAVAETGSVTKAARRCFISQPALTQHIKKLEKQFGFPLFERAEAAWVPTRQGELFLTTARQMLQIENEIHEQIEREKKSNVPVCRIFVDFHLRNPFIEQIWPKYLEHYPGTELRLVSGDTATALEYLTDGTVDMGILPVFGELPPQFGVIPIDQNEYQLILPPGHKAVEAFSGGHIDFSALSEDTFILNQSFSLFSSMQQQILARYGIRPKKILYSHAMQTIARMVSSGQGVSFLPDVFTKITGQSYAAFSLNPPWNFKHAAVYHKSRGLSSSLGLLAELMIRHYEQFHAPDGS